MIFGFPFKFSLLRILDFPSNTGYVCGVLVKSSHLYLYSVFYNTDCIKAASQ